LKVKRVYENIAEEIRRWILDGKLKAGDRLPSEEELIKQFGVSRASLREAFRLLESMGLVETELGKGRFVRNILRKENQELSEALKNALIARELVEPSIAMYAAQVASEQDIKKIQEALRRLELSYNLGCSEFLVHDKAFHIAVAEATHNFMLINFVLDYKSVIEELGAKTLNVKGRRKRSYKEHQQIFEAIKSHNPQAAHKANLLHIQNVKRTIEFLYGKGVINKCKDTGE